MYSVTQDCKCLIPVSSSRCSGFNTSFHQRGVTQSTLFKAFWLEAGGGVPAQAFRLSLERRQLLQGRAAASCARVPLAQQEERSPGGRLEIQLSPARGGIEPSFHSQHLGILGSNLLCKRQ